MVEDNENLAREKQDDHVEAAPDPDMAERLEEALREKDQFRALAQRSQADLVNYRRRAAEELEEARTSSKSRLLLDVISVVDDFGRALEMVPGAAIAPGWLEGVRLVHRKLVSLMESEGVTRIQAEGQPFEPFEHEAVLYQESPGMAEGTVVQVVRDGYKLNGRVLRAAQVAVSRAPVQKKETESPDQE